MNITASKLFEVAKHLHDLNKNGQVKGFSSNENGYAKIIQLCRGCSIWVHHEKNDELIIDLLISPSAKEKQSDLCRDVVRKFQEFFDFTSKKSNWNHSIDTHNDHDRYYVVVTNKEPVEIIYIVETIKKKFA